MKLLSFAGIMFFPYMAFAQVNYVFPEFLQGEIYYKGSAVAASVNYNLFSSDMLVMNGSRKKRLADVDKIEYVSAGNKRFIPLNDNSFGEILISGGLTLAVKYSGHIEKVNEHTGNISKLSLNKMLDSGNPLPEGITIRVDSSYYLIKERNEQKTFYLPGANVAKASHSGFNKLFAKYRSEISAFVESNNTDFSSFESLKQLVEFCEKYVDR
ncbi:MAG: hypothetical protein LBK58_04350 [Prevotellaceae bacterium]|jgi:hypothetical protein|nr:hypothetical protein [Prevotellaceae bacterium]